MVVKIIFLLFIAFFIIRFVYEIVSAIKKRQSMSSMKYVNTEEFYVEAKGIARMRDGGTNWYEISDINGNNRHTIYGYKDPNRKSKDIHIGDSIGKRKLYISEDSTENMVSFASDEDVDLSGSFETLQIVAMSVCIIVFLLAGYFGYNML